MRPIQDEALAYGVNISQPETSRFLTREYGLDISKIQSLLSTQTLKYLTHRQYHTGVIQPGTVILTTSLKHARDLGSELRKIHGKNTEVLIQ
jgi:hypothetical protein